MELSLFPELGLQQRRIRLMVSPKKILPVERKNHRGRFYSFLLSQKNVLLMLPESI
jgi:hypothetical protein